MDFKATRTALPAPLPTSERRTLLEIRIGASYAVFRGDDEEICRRAEENAMRALCRCLYEDVLDDLVPIMRAAGDGKRVEALRLLDRLYTHLYGA